MGLTLIEAIILNKPIVNTNFPTAYDILKSVENSLIIEKTGQEIADAISKIINSGQIMQTNFGDRELTESDITKRTIQMIENLLSD